MTRSGLKMVLEHFSRRTKSQIKEIEQKLDEAIAQTSEQFHTAVNALVNQVEAQQVDTTIGTRDETIRHLIEDIRRRLTIHAAVTGHQVDLPSLLVYMSITKDIDQMGDLARDLWDLADAGIAMAPEERQNVTQTGREVLAFINDTARVFAQRDVDAAATLLGHAGDRIADHRAEMISPTQAHSPVHIVGHVLFHRTVAATFANLANVLASLVPPLDQLDHWTRNGRDPTRPSQ